MGSSTLKIYPISSELESLNQEEYQSKVSQSVHMRQATV
jgi:hypothetical protein